MLFHSLSVGFYYQFWLPPWKKKDYWPGRFLHMYKFPYFMCTGLTMVWDLQLSIKSECIFKVSWNQYANFTRTVLKCWRVNWCTEIELANNPKFYDNHKGHFPCILSTDMTVMWIVNLVNILQLYVDFIFWAKGYISIKGYRPKVESTFTS